MRRTLWENLDEVFPAQRSSLCVSPLCWRKSGRKSSQGCVVLIIVERVIRYGCRFIVPEMSSQQRVGLALGSATPPHVEPQGTGDRARAKTEEPIQYIADTRRHESHERRKRHKRKTRRQGKTQDTRKTGTRIYHREH